jgi:chaperonin GroEL
MKQVTHEESFQAAAGRALEALYLVAKAAYGPKAGVAWLENVYGDPLVSRDGVTNLEAVYLEDPVENMIARGAIQASKENNKQVGDGTTAVIILTYHLYKEARKLVAAGYNRMEVSEQLDVLVEEVEEYVTKLAIKADTKLLQSVAKVSAGNDVLGELISDTIAEVGVDSGVTIEDYAGDGVWPELVEGFYWPKGYTSVQLINDSAKLESRFDDVAILITEKRLATASDIAPILDKIVGQKIHDLVIVGEVDQEALAVLATLRVQGILTATPVDVPAYGGLRSLMLEDLAVTTGGKVLLPGVSPSDFDIEMLGTAEKVIITGNSCSIIGREGDELAITKRIKELQNQYEQAVSPVDRQAIESRLGRLRGKMAIIHVGGATDVEQQEAKLRVQDAVCAVLAASQSGVVPGGGVCLANARTQSPFGKTLQAPFKELVENAGQNPQALVSHLDPAKPWQGFDLKDEGLVEDLKTAGILDPAEVVRQTVRNSVSVVQKIITGTVALTFMDREAKRE